MLRRESPDALAGKPLYDLFENGEIEFEDISRLYDPSSSSSDKFPVSALGFELAKAANAMHDHGIAHMSTCVSAIIGSLSASISPHIDINLWNKQSPTTLWIMHLAESGTGKSQVCAQAFNAFHEVDKQRQIDFSNRLARWFKENEQRKADKDLPVTERPQNWRRWIEDITVAKIMRRLYNASLAPVLLVDEGATFTDGYDFQSPDRQLSAAATLSKLFSGDRVAYSRATDGVDVAVYGRRLCLIVFTQTQSGLVWAQQDRLNANGLCARFLMSMADERNAEYKTKADLMENADFALYQSKLKVFENRQLHVVGGDDPQRADNEPNFQSAEIDAYLCNFETEAVKEMENLSNMWAKRGQGIPEASPMRSFYLRSAEHVGRLAALMCAYENGMEWLYQNDIPIAYVERARKIVEWFHSERRRIIGSDNQNVEDDTETMASLLLEWIGNADDHLAKYRDLRFIRTRAVVQYGPNKLRKKETRERTFKYLEDNGYMQEVKHGKMRYLVINPEA